MFNVRIDSIRERTTNGPTYMKGRQYYRQGRVRHLSFDQDKGIVLSQVEGSRTYNVRIILNSKGEIHDATCTCSAFSAYWGDCRHIAATLLYCVDTFGKQKTHILPEKAIRPVIASSKAKQTGPSDGKTASTQQAQRRSRSKTRDFLTRMETVSRIASGTNKVKSRLRVTLHCSASSLALPWLSFEIGLDKLYPVGNVEQFAEAVSRGLPLELDKDFALIPEHITFDPQDVPLLEMLQDAFENDYKAVFGTSHTSSRDQFLVLNASRFASFLKIAPSLSDSGWQFFKSDERHEIRIREANLPVSLYISRAGDNAADEQYKLSFISDQHLQQMTASRNVYLVGDTFYLPRHENIRLIEPILSVFNMPGFRHLILNHDETLGLISMFNPNLAAICPLKMDANLTELVVKEPLDGVVELDCSSLGLRASVQFHYGDEKINPLSSANAKPITQEPSRLVIRDRAGENRIIELLEKSGFKRHGKSYRLSDPDEIYRFLGQSLDELGAICKLKKRPAARKLAILEPPSIRFRFTLDANSQDLIVSQHYGDLPDDLIPAYLASLRDKRDYLRFPDGRFIRTQLDERDLLLKLAELFALWKVDLKASSLRLPKFRALALGNMLDNADDTALIRADDNVLNMIENLREPDSLSFRLPSAIKVKLRPYQKTGFSWLCTLDYYGLGGILADDMGLGKTLQAIAYMAYVWQKTKKPALIIAPTSLVYNWLSEFEKFAPKLPVMVLDGNRQQRTDRLSEMGGHACVITSYSLLRRDIEEISELDFGCCFLDEAQNIKNPETLNARSVKQVRADRCFALTGTPIENSLTELWSIFDFILPGYLFEQKTFATVFETPITRDQDEQALRELHRQIVPFVLRRMKKDVLKELPAKIETQTICDMTPEQRSIYQAYLANARRDLNQEIHENGYAKSQIFILALLTRLRQICCHPGLFIPDYDGESGKLQLLDELLQDCFALGHRVLVFSQFTSMLELIRKNQAAQGIVPFYIDGQVPAEERLSQVMRFNDGEGELFLVSLRAGGTGLNLTGADTVIHFDPWWNPAVEEQATDRAYRIGQENIVQVIKLYTHQSIEEKILNLQQKKQHLVDSVIKPGQNLLSKMTLDEVRGLFEP